jgi:hypothetical protein
MRRRKISRCAKKFVLVSKAIRKPERSFRLQVSVALPSASRHEAYCDRNKDATTGSAVG